MKKLLANLLWHSGLTKLQRILFPQNKLIVLMYHHVNKEKFEKQIEYLKLYYNIISEKDAYNFFYKSKKLLKNSVLITFDDGYMNNFEEAYPVLKNYKTPAIIFLVTSFIGSNKIIWYDKLEYASNHLTYPVKFEKRTYNSKESFLSSTIYIAKGCNENERDKFIQKVITQLSIKFPKSVPKEFKFMSREQIMKMTPLVSFGAHTINHPILIYSKNKDEEISGSKRELEKILKRPVLSFCYPNGDYDQESNEIVKKDFKMAFTTISGINSKNNPLHIKRIGINLKDDKKILAMKLTPLWRLLKK